MKDSPQDKAIKKLGQDTVEEMNALSQDDLKKVIVQANTSMKQARDELEANPEYQRVKEDLKILTSGLREVDSRQKAKIAYSLELLEAKEPSL